MADRKTAKAASSEDSHMARGSSRGRKTADQRRAVQLADETIIRGEGGETHQTAAGEIPVLTTQQGIPVADDQNSLRVGPRGPTALEDFHFRRKFSISTMSASRSAWCTHAVSVRMAILRITSRSATS